MSLIFARYILFSSRDEPDFRPASTGSETTTDEEVEKTSERTSTEACTNTGFVYILENMKNMKILEFDNLNSRP